MNEQIEFSREQPKEPGLLDLVVQVDAEAIEEMTGLVKEGYLTSDQLPLVFNAARVAVYTPGENKSNARELLRETAKEMSLGQLKELLEPIVRCDQEVARTMLELVKENSVEPDQLPDVLSSAVTGRINLGVGKDNIFYDLARTTACKMSVLCPEQIQEIHNNIVSAFAYPNGRTTAELRVFSEIEILFIEQGIIRNGKIIEIAGKVADGIAAGGDPEKTGIIKQFGDRILGRMPGGKEGDLASIYNALFQLAEYPDKTIYKSKLQTRIDRFEEGESNLRRVLTEAVVERMREAISPKHKDGDPNLPKPRKWRTTLTKVAQFLTIRPKRGNQLALAGRRP